MMDLPSLYMLLQGGGTGFGQQPKPQQPQQQSSYLPMMRMHGFGANSALGGPWAAAAPPTQAAQAAMPMLQQATAAPPQQPGQGAQGDMMKYMMLTGGLDQLFQALRGS